MIYHAPTLTKAIKSKSIFLAGSIENGKAVDWQTEYSERLDRLGFDVYNPRRPDWDSTWEPKASNPQFKEQVEWELNYITAAKYCVFRFIENTVSPISLLELGYRGHLFPQSTFVICDEDYFRKGNIDIFCGKFKVYRCDEEFFFDIMKHV